MSTIENKQMYLFRPSQITNYALPRLKAIRQILERAITEKSNEGKDIEDVARSALKGLFKVRSWLVLLTFSSSGDART